MRVNAHENTFMQLTLLQSCALFILELLYLENS